MWHGLEAHLPLGKVSQKPILGLLRLGIGKVQFSDSAIFNGRKPLKMAMHPYIAEGVAFCDTLLGRRVGVRT